MRRMPSRSSGGSEVEGGIGSRSASCSAKRLRTDAGANDAGKSPLTCVVCSVDFRSDSTQDWISGIEQRSSSVEQSVLSAFLKARDSCASSLCCSEHSDIQATNTQAKLNGKSVANTRVIEERGEIIMSIIYKNKRACQWLTFSR